MRIRRYLPPTWTWRLPRLDPKSARRWGAALAAAVLAGYLTAYLIIFPAPILRRHQVVPRVLGLSLQEASDELRKARLRVQDGGAEPHPTVPQGSVIWQDPPPGVSATAGLRVTLVVSTGAPRIPVPDVAGLEGALAERIVAAAGLTVSQVESVQAAVPQGIAMLTRPPATTVLAPGASVTLVVSRGAPTIPVPSVLGMSQADARTRLEMDGLSLGTVTRQRTTDASPGTVVLQRPGAGTLAAPGTVVDIVVARSPQE
ncbi:MAG TPA: PASTA domain-containing protein [Gemmatimonadales bacterium]|nr:PASTA domain-containing protein [Gemmatimonadales bacterium]